MQLRSQNFINSCVSKGICTYHVLLDLSLTWNMCSGTNIHRLPIWIFRVPEKGEAYRYDQSIGSPPCDFRCFNDNRSSQVLSTMKQLAIADEESWRKCYTALENAIAMKWEYTAETPKLLNCYILNQEVRWRHLESCTNDIIKHVDQCFERRIVQSVPIRTSSMSFVNHGRHRC